jgi:hypothetical protein
MEPSNEQSLCPGWRRGWVKDRDATRALQAVIDETTPSPVFALPRTLRHRGYAGMPFILVMEDDKLVREFFD